MEKPVQILVMREGEVVSQFPILPPGSAQSRTGVVRGPMLVGLSEIFALAGNERRLLVMDEMLKRAETRFTDLLAVAVNPKLVSDCIQPMLENNLVVHGSRRAPYLLSRKGVVVVTLLTRGMAELLRAEEDGRI